MCTVYSGHNRWLIKIFPNDGDKGAADALFLIVFYNYITITRVVKYSLLSKKIFTGCTVFIEVYWLKQFFEGPICSWALNHSSLWKSDFYCINWVSKSFEVLTPWNISFEVSTPQIFRNFGSPSKYIEVIRATQQYMTSVQSARKLRVVGGPKCHAFGFTARN